LCCCWCLLFSNILCCCWCLLVVETGPSQHLQGPTFSGGCVRVICRSCPALVTTGYMNL
jgi:hypothetical protein